LAPWPNIQMKVDNGVNELGWLNGPVIRSVRFVFFLSIFQIILLTPVSSVHVHVADKHLGPHGQETTYMQ